MSQEKGIYILGNMNRLRIISVKTVVWVMERIQLVPVRIPEAADESVIYLFIKE